MKLLLCLAVRWNILNMSLHFHNKEFIFIHCNGRRNSPLLQHFDGSFWSFLRMLEILIIYKIWLSVNYNDQLKKFHSVRIIKHFRTFICPLVGLCSLKYYSHFIIIPIKIRAEEFMTGSHRHKHTKLRMSSLTAELLCLW